MAQAAGKRKAGSGLTSKKPPPKKKKPSAPRTGAAGEEQQHFAPRTDDAEQLKIIRKLMPLIRADKTETMTAKDFHEFGRHLDPPRDGRTVKKVLTRFLHGDLWNQFGPAPNPEHEPVRVNREIQRLRAKRPGITLPEIATELKIHPSTFRDIYAKVELLPPFRTIYSRDNPKFASQYLWQLHLPMKGSKVRMEIFSLTHLGVLGRIEELLDMGVDVTLLLDWRMVMAPYQLVCVKRLLAKKKAGAKLKILVQKQKSKTQHIKFIIVDDVFASSGSVNPSFKGLTQSYESLTYHFMAAEVVKALVESKAKEADFFEIDDEWVSEQEKRNSNAQRMAAAMASEGLTEGELAAIPLFADGEGGAFVAAELKEKAHKRDKAQYDERREAGVCTSCKALPADSGLSRCSECRRKKEVKYHLQQELGLCTQCGNEKPPGETRSRCEECRSKQNAHAGERRRLRAPGICRDCCTRNCAVKPGNKGLYARCNECRASHKKCRKPQKKPGQCSHCSKACTKKKNGKFYSQCSSCRATVAKNQALRADKREALGLPRCPKVKHVPGECPTCHAPTEKKEGGTFYYYCKTCRVKQCKVTHASYLKRKLQKSKKPS